MRHHRVLTRGEQSLAEYVFRNSISHGQVHVTQRATDIAADTAWAPFGAVTFSKSRYREDFVGEDMFHPDVPDDAHWFLHELVHVWQYYQGMNLPLLAIRARLGGGKGHDPYAYDLSAAMYGLGAAPDLLDYNIEQQGDIVADYYGKKLWGFQTPLFPVAAYEAVLSRFLRDPLYPRTRKNLWRFRSAFRAAQA